MSIRTRYSAAFVLAMSLADAAASTSARADATDEDADMAQYRERFKQGLDRYEANDVAGALSFWEPLYRDLGPARGYRVGYNLARAYEVFGDATRAAERYQSFLDEVKQRRKEGKHLDDEAATDEGKSIARLDELGHTRGRIHVGAATPPESVRVDQAEARLAGFVAYVTPGPHVVVFGPGSSKEHTERVTVGAGEVVELAPPVEPAPPVFRESTHRPFGSGWLWAAGATTVLLGGGLTAFGYVNATVLHDRASPAATESQVDQYNTARTLAYASWAVPVALGVVSVVMVIWYFAGTRHARVPVGIAF